ncbi:hypothetical protein HDV04_002337 [Boothiomyces sp. JEL0838]|nr:hypothetical protein HDV04_002531 [Boothiomyces sp. JEL0838]KAJ3313176.1 hypothetical protein HDV04_002337 [Boothiomyces sp. JEL0838]
MNTSSEPKKPLNSFFHYRKAKKQEIVEKYNITKSHEISRKAAELWANESKQVRDYFQQVSMDEHNKFKELYPDYDWQPWKRDSKSKSPKSPHLIPKSPNSKRRSAPLVATAPTQTHLRISKSSESLYAFHLDGIMNSGAYRVSPDVYEAAKLDSDIDFAEFADPNIFDSPVNASGLFVGCNGSPVSTTSFDFSALDLEQDY